jgi:hypothetical protein
MSRTTQEKLTLFAGCFSGLPNVYGTYDPVTGKVWQAKAPVTAEVMLAHLQGLKPYGVYLLTGDITRAVVADFDHDDREPVLAFRNEAARRGIAVYIERSKRKGWHAWIFAPPQGVSAHKARSVVTMILTDIGHPKTEVFPKQDRLAGPNDYGNFINAPLFGKLVSAGRTVFVDPEVSFQPYIDQWDLLASIRRVTESQLDEIIDRNDCGTSEEPAKQLVGVRTPETTSKTFGLPPCAQRMLREGVTDNQRVSCFRLAVDLKRAGVPEELTLAALNLWSRKNRPTGHKKIIGAAEIASQTRDAYGKTYRSCGCDHAAVKPFCSSDCSLYPASSPSTSPAVSAAPSQPPPSPASSIPPPSAAQMSRPAFAEAH